MDLKERLEIAELYDMYGELLTDKQRSMIEQYIYEDNSLQEVSERMGVSRQAVCDSLKQASGRLRKYEKMLGALELRHDMKCLIDELRGENPSSSMTKIIDRMEERLENGGNTEDET